MSEQYERPTDDLRQVKRPIKRGNGVCGPGHHDEIIGWDTTIQRRWQTHPKGTRDSFAAQWSTWTDEWRDLPTIWTEKPQAHAQ